MTFFKSTHYFMTVIFLTEYFKGVFTVSLYFYLSAALDVIIHTSRQKLVKNLGLFYVFCLVLILLTKSMMKNNLFVPWLDETRPTSLNDIWLYQHAIFLMKKRDKNLTLLKPLFVFVDLKEATKYYRLLLSFHACGCQI